MMKLNKNKEFCLILLLFFVVFDKTYAQNELSLHDAISKAWVQNRAMKISALEIDAQKQFAKTAKELPKAFADLQVGRTQVFNMNDFTAGLSQQFNHPKYYKTVANLLNKQVEVLEQNEFVRKNEIAFRIKDIFAKYYYFSDLNFLLKQQDSLFAVAQKAAQIKYETGDTSLLEKVSSETRTQENLERINSLDNEKLQLAESLRFSLNAATQIFPKNANLRNRNELIINELTVKNNPLLNVLVKLSEVSVNQTQTEKAKLLPDFKVGVLGQTIEHRIPQIVLQGGIGIPIFAKAQKARITAYEVNEKIANEKLQFAENELQSTLNIALQNFQKVEKLLKFYEETALPQGDLILKTAIKQYKNGEISYSEYVVASTQAWQIKENYLNKRLELNLIFNEIEYLTGKNLTID